MRPIGEGPKFAFPVLTRTASKYSTGVAMATEMRLRWLRPKKKFVENLSFDRFLLCFQVWFNDKLKKTKSYCLKFGQESGSTLF